MSKSGWTALSVALLVGACTPSEKPDAQAIVKQLRDIEAQWNRDYATRNVEGLVGHYAADGALANPGAALVTSTDQIRAADTQFVADPNLQVQFASDRVQVARSGDLAYTRGHYTMRSTDPKTHKPRADVGNYLTVWQKQADGSWKAIEDFVTPGPEAPPTP